MSTETKRLSDIDPFELKEVLMSIIDKMQGASKGEKAVCLTYIPYNILAEITISVNTNKEDFITKAIPSTNECIRG